MTTWSPRQIRKRIHWTCPHCGVGEMSVDSAIRHMRRRHLDCLSCRAETTMLRGMLSGIGNFWFTTPGMDILGSRA